MRHTKAKDLRASWKGQLRIDLVSVPVQAFNVLSPEEGEFRLHQLHAICHSRIRHQKVCPLHGNVPAEEIVLGYEYGREQYVEILPEELERLRTEGVKTLSIDAFIAPDQLDPIYLDGRAYYLTPDGPEARKPYGVLLAAMERKNRYGIGTVVLAEREQLVLLRPLGGLLVMAMLRSEVEVRAPGDLGIEIPSGADDAQEIQLAEALIAAESEEPFEFSRYENRYRQRLSRLIEAKLRGKEKELAAAEAEPAPAAISLMDALKESVAHAQGRAPTRPGRGFSRPHEQPSVGKGQQAT